MYYVVQSRRNPQDRTKPARYYAIRRSIGRKELRDVAHHIEKRTSLTVGDVLNVLENSIDIITEFIKDGYSVNMGVLGTFHGTFRSNGKDAPDEITAADIHSPRITFVGSSDLKKLFADCPFHIYPDI